ncbi:MAG TPA: phosphate ABC transporter substrate-binding protein PstS [Polyangiaceae bacterium]|nr:phosphate ABC transporter substrate-binding protein PstS [Polyangiaceae bacterium]
MACSNDGVVTLNGAGATFPYPLYSKWIEEYRAVAPGVRINYQSIGSGAGVRQIVARTVDFGATDVPAEPDETRDASGPLVEIPAAVGSVVLSYNLPGLTAPLKLTPALIAAIYLGAITRWNDPALAAVNPGVALPEQAIGVVFRTDGSGTTALFTRYLTLTSSEWSARVGAGKSLRWPVGIGAKGNEGVTGVLQATPGSIGYTELAYATQNRLALAAVANRGGHFVLPSVESAAAAAAAMPASDSLKLSLETAPGEAAYPLSAYTYLLLYADNPDARRGEALAEFVWWAVHDGQRLTRPLDYAPLPPSVVSTVETRLRALKAGGRPALAH